MTTYEDRLTEILEPAIEAAGFEPVRIRMTGSREKTLQVMAERPDGTMSAEDCAALSRALSEVLEEKDPIEDPYTLEVSSPGIDRPLTRLKDFERWDGFAAKIELTQAVENQKRFRGYVAGVEDDNVLFDIEGEDETALIPFELIAAAKLLMTDELITESLRRSKAALKEGDAEWEPNRDGPRTNKI
ncbi:ribosome maturation factor RimP [Parvularcula sp. ZS-1/3]|uniref:Ribosome maturation factor RimP n=1 Tax=Parvularcula mediterranea TaxID=2732508 RepID=A0A7Y3W4Y7_9PROT|nr:ribosome maturation factor RimP [Parvularcula mediterranea]NNU15681.1 ribosome maturation factor RimP [Parvularcula mediterranea]